MALVPLTGGYLTDGEHTGDETYPVGLPLLSRTFWHYPLNLYYTVVSTTVALVAQCCSSKAALIVGGDSSETS